jgi:hypothetical protein
MLSPHDEAPCNTCAAHKPVHSADVGTYTLVSKKCHKNTLSTFTAKFDLAAGRVKALWDTCNSTVAAKALLMRKHAGAGTGELQANK